MSFSGLKNALRLLVRKLEAEGVLADEVPHVAASFQAAVVDVLTQKTMRAVRRQGCRRVVLGGGVANSRALRESIRGKAGAGRGTVRAVAAAFHRQRGDDRARGALSLAARGGRRAGPERPRGPAVSRADARIRRRGTGVAAMGRHDVD